jgi:predicted MFS family arabinose efflux permease
VTPARRGPKADQWLGRAALATALVFAVNGFLLASWVSRLPATRDRLGASAAELGLALLTPGFGSLLSMPFSGRWCRRFGSRVVIATTTVAASLALVALAVVPTLVALGLTLFVWGSFYGSWDVAMNVHGSAVEQRAGREWMPRYHACWSVGGIAGAACGALAAQVGMPLILHFSIVAVLCTALVMVALRSFIEDRTQAPEPALTPAAAPTPGAAAPLDPAPGAALDPSLGAALDRGLGAALDRGLGAALDPGAPQPPDPVPGPPEGESSPRREVVAADIHSPPGERGRGLAGERGRRRSRERGREPGRERGREPGRGRVLTGRLLLVGVVTLCATTLEGAAADWLALYLTDDRGATASLAAAGYAVFAVAMAGGRFSGTVVAERLGRHGAVRVGGLVSFVGVLVTVLGPGLVSVYVGAALWALGVCLVFPAAVSAGGEAPERPADAIAAVTTIGYGGFLVGPPLIGLLAEQVGLGRALLVLLVLAGGIAALAPAVRSRRPPAGPVGRAGGPGLSSPDGVPAPPLYRE